MACPQDFKCPISMEIMKDPVTISTGFTYERSSIQKWFISYKKTTCPVTLQKLENFDVTPNYTLKRLIQTWQYQSVSSPPSIRHQELISLITAVDESTPFKVSSLKNLRSFFETDDIAIVIADFKKAGGIEVLIGIIVQVVISESPDFATFRACEEALAIIHQVLAYDQEDEMKLFMSNAEAIKSMAIMLQRGSKESRFYAVSILHKLSKAAYDWSFFIRDHGVDFFKSVLELVSDEICTKASSRALQVMIEILSSSKKSSLKAIEAGAICVLIELLPESNKSKCEKIMEIIKLLCECAEGRLAFIEHELGISAVANKILHVSDVTSKIGVKIFWLVCKFHPSERVFEEMLMVGAVKKMVALLYTDGRSSTKEKAAKILKSHGNSWRRYPCFPNGLKDYLGLGTA